MMKKILLAIASVAVMLVSCTPEEQLGPATLKVQPETLDLALEGDSQTITLKATRDWTVTVDGKNMEGITVTPMSGKGSNDPVTVTVTAEKNEGYNRSVKLVFKAGTAMEEEVVVKQAGSLGAAIADLYFANAGDPFTVTGLVIASHERGCIIKDETGTALVFDKSATKSYTEVGTTIKVTGIVGVHNGNAQIIPAEGATTEFVVKTDADKVDVSFPSDATVVTKDNYEDINWDEFEPVVMTGICSSNNGYININFGAGAAAEGSVSYPLADLGFDQLSGKNVELMGYTLGISSDRYHNILVVSVKEVELDIDKSNIEDLFAATMEDGTTVLLEGQVVATHQRGYMLKDNTGIVYVYCGENANTKEGFPSVGNNVTIIAQRDTNYEHVQVKSATIQKNDNAVAAPEHGEPKDISNTLDTEDVSKPIYVYYEGTLSGDNANVVQIGEQKYVAQLYWSIDSYAACLGMTVKVKGYTISRNTSSNYIGIIPVEVASDPYLATPEDLFVDKNVTSAEMTVPSYGVDWSYVFEGEQPAWVKEHKKSDDGKKIILTLEANETGEVRETTIKISADDMTDVTAKLTQSNMRTMPYTSNLATWENISKDNASYKEKVSIKDTKYECLKLGKKDTPGWAIIQLPAGTKKVGFYAIAWKGTATTLKLSIGETVVGTIKPVAQDGASSSGTYYVTPTSKDYYEVEVNVADASSLKVESLKDTGDNDSRLIMWGINAVNE